MSEAAPTGPPVVPPADLGDLFKAKGKKKIKSSNLNNKTTESKPEDKKKAKGKDEEDGWEEQEVVASTMKVEAAGKLMREEEKAEEDTSAPAWGSLKNKASKQAHAEALSDKKYPTLAKSIAVSTNINIDDGSDPTINIKTSKNAFSALENDDDGDNELKRPKEIKPAMVKKKKGEFEKAAVKREVDKYTAADKRKKKKEAKAENDDESEDESESEEESEDEEEKQKEYEAAKKKAAVKKVVKKVEEKEDKEDEEDDRADDVKTQPDLAACKAKYKHRRRLPVQDLSAEEMQEPKRASKVAAKAAGGGKKKKGYVDEEALYAKKLQYAD